MIETSQDVGELAKALAAAQGKIMAASKDRANPYFNSTYATLASVWDACRGPLTDHGLSVVQLPVNDGQRVGVVTTLLHSSGQWMRSALYATPEKQTPQALGSCLTYCRRYALAAAVGVAPDDDDGNEASGKTNGKPESAGGAQRANKVPAAGPKATEAQYSEIRDLKERIGGWTGKAEHPKHPYRAALAAYKDEAGKPVQSAKDLTRQQADNLLVRMRGMADRQESTHRAMENGTPTADDGEAPGEELLDNVRAAAMDRWGKNVEDQGPRWLREHFGVAKTTELSKLQASKALELLLSQ